jgi:hypothetical protein
MITLADIQPKAKLEESILVSMMKRLGVDATDFDEDTSYTEDIMQAINTHIVALTQLGIGPKEGFRVEDETTTWGDLLDDRIDLEAAKDYIYLKVKLGFDPPPAAAIDAYNEMAKEAIVRCSYVVEGLTLN